MEKYHIRIGGVDEPKLSDAAVVTYGKRCCFVPKECSCWSSMCWFSASFFLPRILNEPNSLDAKPVSARR
jgi:hypothetical protein